MIRAPIGQGVGAPADAGRATAASQSNPSVSSKACIPSAASFDVGKYSDGSGPVVRVRYDTTSDFATDRVWIDGGDYSEQWIAFDWNFAAEICDAIMTAAQAIEAHQGGDGTAPSQDESAVPEGNAP